MTPEVWETIRRDWRESLPAVLNGTDDRIYEMDWAVNGTIPRTIKTSFLYLCASNAWEPCEIMSRRHHKGLAGRREAIALVLQRRHSNTTLCQIAKVMNRDNSTLSNMLDRARTKEAKSPEFARMVADLECLV
jgi:hypothetical protein